MTRDEQRREAGRAFLILAGIECGCDYGECGVCRAYSAISEFIDGFKPKGKPTKSVTLDTPLTELSNLHQESLQIEKLILLRHDIPGDKWEFKG